MLRMLWTLRKYQMLHPRLFVAFLLSVALLSILLLYCDEFFKKARDAFAERLQSYDYTINLDSLADPDPDPYNFILLGS